jgi:hypothetical protein
MVGLVLTADKDHLTEEWKYRVKENLGKSVSAHQKTGKVATVVPLEIEVISRHQQLTKNLQNADSSRGLWRLPLQLAYVKQVPCETARGNSEWQIRPHHRRTISCDGKSDAGRNVYVRVTKIGHCAKRSRTKIFSSRIFF